MGDYGIERSFDTVVRRLGQAVENPFQGDANRLPADTGPVTAEAGPASLGNPWSEPGKTDRSHRFVGGAAGRARDTRHCDRPLGTARAKRAFRHRQRRFFADSAELLDRPQRYGKLPDLRLIRIGYEATVEPVRATGHGRDGARDEPPGARLGGGDAHLALQRGATERDRQPIELIVDPHGEIRRRQCCSPSRARYQYSYAATKPNRR